jgi:hypothetical protein
MKRILLFLALVPVLGFALGDGAQDLPSGVVHAVRRIKIRHADPELIIRLLKAMPVNQPEYSSIRP